MAGEPLVVDGTCPACRADRYNLCEKKGFNGISGRGGGLSEYIVVERRWVHPVGDLPLDQAAMIEPLAVALHSAKHAGVVAGQTAVGGNARPIGLLVAAVLKAKWLRTIVSEMSTARREKALSTGVADVVIDPAREDLGPWLPRARAARARTSRSTPRACRPLSSCSACSAQAAGSRASPSTPSR